MSDSELEPPPRSGGLTQLWNWLFKLYKYVKVNMGKDFKIEAAMGRKDGYEVWNKFGYNKSVPAGTEVIASWSAAWSPTGVTSGAEDINIYSSDAADQGGSGTGARTLYIVGVDGNGDPQEKLVPSIGSSGTPATTSLTWRGINRVYVLTAGSGGANAGTISMVGATTGEAFAEIPIGDNVTQQCIFFTPADNTFLAEWLVFNAIKLSGGGTPEFTFNAYAYSYATGMRYEVFEGHMDVSISNFMQYMPPEPFVIGPNQCFWLEVTSDTASSSVNGRFSGLLVRNS